MTTTAGELAHVVTRSGVEYVVTGATYLGDRASCVNGPLWEVHARRMHDDAGAYWHESTAPVIGLRTCDPSAPCPTMRAGLGCYLHEIRAAAGN
jgi:hypothetical protein